MAENKKSFVLYCDYIDSFNELTDEEAGKLIKHLLAYVNDKNPAPLEDRLIPVYRKITEQIKFEWAKFNPETGKYHWNYKGGITPENKAIRSSMAMKIWRFSVFERDRYTCQHCGQKGGELHAHHIKPFSEFKELRFEVDNGVTLCKKCHIKVHSKKQ